MKSTAGLLDMKAQFMYTQILDSAYFASDPMFQVTVAYNKKCLCTKTCSEVFNCTVLRMFMSTVKQTQQTYIL